MLITITMKELFALFSIVIIQNYLFQSPLKTITAADNIGASKANIYFKIFSCRAIYPSASI